MAAISSQVEEVVRRLAGEVSGELGLELLELKLAQAGKRNLLRIVVDTAEGPDGVTVEECASLSRSLSRRLDDEDVIPASYVLEVSSPGATRPFDSPKRYRRNQGKRIAVWLREALEPKGKLHVKGILEAVRDDGVTLRFDDDRSFEIPFENVRKACRTVEF